MGVDRSLTGWGRPKSRYWESTIIQSVVPIRNPLSPFLHGPCLPISWPLKLTLPGCYSACALPVSLFPFTGSRPMYMTDLMDPDCNTTTAALQLGMERSVPYTLWDMDMEAPQCLFAFGSRVAPLSTVQQWAVEEVQDRAAQGRLRCQSTIWQRPRMEAVSPHTQTGLGNGFRSLRELFCWPFLYKCCKKVLLYSAN